MTTLLQVQDPNIVQQEALGIILDVLEIRVYNYFNEGEIAIRPLSLNPDSNLSQMIDDYELDYYDIMLLALAYAWEYEPHRLSPLVTNFVNAEKRAQYGGSLESSTARFFPDLKTFIALFFSSENHGSAILKYSATNYPLTKYGIISFKEKPHSGDGHLNQSIQLSVNYAQFLQGGEAPRLDHEPDFPARLLTPKVNFEEVVLTEETRDELSPLLRYMNVRPELKKRPELRSKVVTNYITVFSGSPGTGKSLTATSLGGKYNLPTYTLDLSRVLSRYVGDFEKAMERVFTRLEGKDCILFIDEADSIFTKRQENVNDTQDKYANQEMSYLLQRLERFEGIVILATNVQDIRTHLDKAMLRRISTIVDFPFPLMNERRQLWMHSLPNEFSYVEGVVEEVSTFYQLTGANIANIISGVIIEALNENVTFITLEMIELFIKKEFYKRDTRFMKCTDDSPGAILMEQRLGRTAVHNGRRM